jgi:adenylyltransferase/sulfurtransferase
MLFAPIGPDGQARLASSRVVIIGCGALGSALAEQMVRAGVGQVRVCDRDFVERSNLQRQALFDENDVRDNLPKAEAARRKLAIINSETSVEAVVTDVNPDNAERLCDGADAILDGTDNFETRYLINDVAIKHSIPWVYGAAVAASGLVLPILPGETPCLRCVFDEAPPVEHCPTCDTVGVLGPLIHVVTGLQAVEVLKILVGHQAAVNRHLVSVDLWTGRLTSVNVDAAAGEDCVCCQQRRFEYLDWQRFPSAASLCGRGAVQINRKGDASVNLAALADRLAPVAGDSIRVNEFLLRAKIDRYELTVFPDGRTIIEGTGDPDVARSVHARYVGP